MYYINCFFVYSILGYILEIVFALLIGAHPNSGVLYGPWTPIYGIASLIIIFISEYIFKHLSKNKLTEAIIVFIILTILLTILEGISGKLIEIFFGFSFWNYEKTPLNIGKYICIPFALIWGILSIIFIYIIRPKIDKYIHIIPKELTLILIILFIIDWIIRFMVEINLL